MAAITIVRIGRAYASVKTPSGDAAGGAVYWQNGSTR